MNLKLNPAYALLKGLQLEFQSFQEETLKLNESKLKLV